MSRKELEYFSPLTRAEERPTRKAAHVEFLAPQVDLFVVDSGFPIFSF